MKEFLLVVMFVPLLALTRVEGHSSIFARPKSSTFTLPSGGSLMFPGLRSRMDDPLGMRRLHRLGALQSTLSVPQSGMIAASLRCRVLSDGIKGLNRILIGRIQGPSLTGRNQEWRGATAKRSTPPARRAWSSRWHPSMTGRGGEGTRGTPSLGWRGRCGFVRGDYGGRGGGMGAPTGQPWRCRSGP